MMSTALSHFEEKIVGRNLVFLIASCQLAIAIFCSTQEKLQPLTYGCLGSATTALMIALFCFFKEDK